VVLLYTFLLKKELRDYIGYFENFDFVERYCTVRIRCFLSIYLLKVTLKKYVYISK
jgi:hypothetical protein